MKHTKLNLLILIGLLSLSQIGNAQPYNEGETLTDETLDRVISFCSNGPDEMTLRELLVDQNDGSPNAVWLSFFATW